MTIHEKLQQIIDVAPIIKSALAFDLVLSVTDTEKIVWVSRGKKFDTGLKVGERMNPASPINTVLKEKKMTLANVPESVYGVPITACAIPLFDDVGNIIGTFGSATLRENEKILQNLSENMMKKLNYSQTNMIHVQDGMENLTDLIRELKKESEMVKQQLSQTSQILNIIQGIANNTNMLGLNASIESSRIGELGKGFAVVAQEIRKLSLETVSSAKKIEDIMDNLGKAINQVGISVDNISAIEKNQAENIASVCETIQELQGVSKELEERAKKLY